MGRESEFAALCELARSPHTSLISVVGPGGVGKSRLAIHVANEVRDSFVDGVAIVDLLAVSDFTSIPAALLQSLRVQSEANEPAPNQLQDFLQEREMLLVLDNFEHLTGAAPQVSGLLSHCRKVTIIVTSRTPLGLRDEQQFELESLALPPPDADCCPELLEAWPAVALFVERAKAVKKDFRFDTANGAMVAAICRQLDGLPLAIELAAARMKILTLPALLEYIERPGGMLAVLSSSSIDRPARQASLRSSLAWSYDRLDEDKRRLVDRLAIFEEGCSLATAAALAEIGGQCSPLDLLQRLIESGFILVDGADGSSPALASGGAPSSARLRMLRTTRAFVVDRLSNEARDESRRALAEHFGALADEAGRRLASPDHHAWVMRLRKDWQAIEATLAWSLTNAADGSLALRLVAGFWRFWYLTSTFSAGLQWLETVLKRVRPIQHDNLEHCRAEALYGAGIFAWLLDDQSKDRAYLSESVELWQRLHNRRGEAFALLGMASTARGSGVGSGAIGMWDAYEQSLTIFREIDERWGLAFALVPYGNAAITRADYELAQRSLDESHAIFRSLHDDWGVAFANRFLGRLAFLQGQLDLALKLLEPSAACFKFENDLWNAGGVLNQMGEVRAKLGDLDQAGALFAESLRCHRTVNSGRFAALALQNLGDLAHRRGDLEQAARAYEEGLNISTSLGQQTERAFLLHRLGEVLAELGRFEYADEIIRERNALIQKPGLPRRLAKDLAARERSGEGGHEHLVRVSDREAAVLRLIAAGKSNPEIAETLIISIRTVTSHITHIFNKIGVSNRVEAALWASRHGLSSASD